MSGGRGGETVRIKVHVVAGDAPLLLSLPTQQRMGVILDLVRGTLKIRGQQSSLLFCPRGHPALPLTKPPLPTPLGEVYSCNSLALSEDEWQSEVVLLKVLTKLHVQYSHISIHKIVAMLRTVRGTKGVGVLLKVAEKFVCHHCIKFAKSKPNPVVAAPRVPGFNHQIYTDVFWVKGVMILHMVCAYSAYRQAAVLAEKTGQAVVLALLKILARIFWANEKPKD